MKEEGLGYRRISKKLNEWGIKTHRGCEWFNTSVSSALKRKNGRDDIVKIIVRISPFLAIFTQNILCLDD